MPGLGVRFRRAQGPSYEVYHRTDLTDPDIRNKGNAIWVGAEGGERKRRQTGGAVGSRDGAMRRVIRTKRLLVVCHGMRIGRAVGSSCGRLAWSGRAAELTR